MNPWAFLLGGLGVILIVIGVKGTQHQVGAALQGKAAPSGGSSKAPGKPIPNTPQNNPNQLQPRAPQPPGNRGNQPIQPGG